MAALNPFHLAFPVTSLRNARRFYGELMGCPEGRSSDEWVDFDFFGHQIVAHLSPEEAGQNATNAVDGHNVPVRPFGIVLDMAQWTQLADKLREGTPTDTSGVVLSGRCRRGANSRPCILPV